ncbi:PKHD1L1 [Bugula neritina]|uniref:PKHD1L1 n=1 Tax=Bugula neritina TaxID=10212 RepID=A0A7J7KC95_BUGNE|nr:PKHD1L1 [Bugula neritina]
MFRWNYDGVFRDLDGSLSGVAGGNVLTWTDTLDPDKCVKDDRFSQGAAQGAVCDETTQFARLSFNHPNMQSIYSRTLS